MPLVTTKTREDHVGCLQQLWQYRLQFEVMMPAAIVFVAGGMKIGWATYELLYAAYDYDVSSNFLTISWMVGAIAGILMASFFAGHTTKNIAHILSGGLLVVGGIFFIVLPTTITAIACSCIFEGAAFGVLQLQTFITGAEVAHKDIRGLLMSTERYFIWFGILLQLTFTYSWYALEPTNSYTTHVDQVHGFVITCLGLTTILWALKLRIESPLLLLKQQRDEAAVEALRQLQGRCSSDTELLGIRDDYLKLLSVDADDSRWYIFRNYNMLPLLSVLTLRCFVGISMSQPLIQFFLSASWLGFDCDTNCLYILALTGLLGSLLGGLLVDRYGRRKLCVVTLLPATIFIFIAGGIMNYLSKAEVATVSSHLEIVSILILLYQFIISLGISTTATVYLSEAFTVTQKSQCIAAVLIGENLLQILMTVISCDATLLFFAIGVMCLQLGLYVFLCMPETKSLTLYECLLKFKGASLKK